MGSILVPILVSILISFSSIVWTISGRFLDSFWLVFGSVLADFDTAVVADFSRRCRTGVFFAAIVADFFGVSGHIWAYLSSSTCKYPQIAEKRKDTNKLHELHKKDQNLRKCNYIATSVLRAQRASERSELSARSDERRQRVAANDKRQRLSTTCHLHALGLLFFDALPVHLSDRFS